MMNSRICYVFLVIFVVAGTSITSVFAAPISIETDSDAYDHSSVITVTGQIANLDPNYPAIAFKAIEVIILPDGSYVFQLKPEYSSSIRKYASKPLLSRATQKTLSYIALEQPISSKQLLEVRGSGVYAQLKELRQLNFIEHQSVGRLRIYSTTEKFQKYFGIEGDVTALKQKLFKKIRK